MLNINSSVIFLLKHRVEQLYRELTTEKLITRVTDLNMIITCKGCVIKSSCEYALSTFINVKLRKTVNEQINQVNPLKCEI